jgi:SagB-type dehydrogenase family enzyme
VTWTSLHCRLSWQPEHVDAFIVDELAPLFDDDWFFVRYWETGPHLRIRYHGSPDLRQDIQELVTASCHPVLDIDPAEYRASINAPDGPWLPHGDVREVPYEPEPDRYGGVDALPLAEDLFCRSTEVAVAVLRSVQSGSAKLSAAIDLTIATTRALGLARPAAAAWLRVMGVSRRYAQEPTSPPTLESHRAAYRILARHGREISARWCRPPNPATTHWTDHIRDARTEMELPPHVWAAQLHMLFNRIGITPELERMTSWLVAASALSPDGMTPFHDNDDDLRYLEASKFLPGFTDRLPKTVEPRPQPEQRGTWSVPLPTPDILITPLDTALKARHTSRAEELSGTLDIQQLSTLLATAQGDRPYPSAGAQYCARVRVIALAVDGLAPACYEFDEVNEMLAWTGPCPSIKDLESTSMWFGPDTTELAGTPAVLALYVRIGDLRQAYGMRAVRFAFTEAGHVAQNFGLVAAAMGLSIGTVGGIYDDLAHDLLALDGVNDTLVYLMPVAAQSLGQSLGDAQ